MANWCLPPNLVDSFKEAFTSGALSPERLMDMSSADRREAFSKYVGEDHAKEVNALFESKLILKDQQRGLLNFLNKATGVSEPVRRSLVDRIQKLDKVLQPADEQAFLSDLAAQKLGTAVTADEAQTIFDLSKAAQEARDAPSDSLSGVSDAYLNASEDLKSYIASLKPVTPLKSIGMNAMVIARNNLIMNPSTPIKTSVSQVENSLIDAVTRRLASGELGGLNGKITSQAKAEAWTTYRKTGFNTASMETLSDNGKLGEGNRFEAPSGIADAHGALRVAEGAVRKVAQWSNKIVIDWAHVVPFTKFYQSAFYDAVDIMSSHLAKSEGLSDEAARARAETVFRDASRVEPTTAEGAAIRHAAQQQGARITSTNDTWVSSLAMAVKDALNRKVLNGLGDALMPIAKIPANVIWNGIENAGPGIPLGVRDIILGRDKIQSTDLATRYEGMAQFAGGIQKTARTVGSIAAAAFFAHELNATDFKQDRYGANFVKIGGVWLNMEYISAVSPALAGMMTVKQHEQPGDSIAKSFGQYVAGAAAPLKNAPGLNEVGDLVKSVTDLGGANGFGKYLKDFFTSRGIPAFVQNLSKDRPVERLFFGAHGVETPHEVVTDKYTAALHKVKNDMTVWGQPLNDSPGVNDPVNKRLEDIAYVPKFPSQTVRGVKLTPDQYKGLVQTSGRLAYMRLESLTGSPGWDSLPVATRTEIVKKAIAKSRDMAETELMLKHVLSRHDVLQKATDRRMAAAETP